MAWTRLLTSSAVLVCHIVRNARYMYLLYIIHADLMAYDRDLLQLRDKKGLYVRLHTLNVVTIR